MKDAAIIILVIYCLIQAFVVWYFFVYKNKEADREYQKRLNDIYK